MKSTKQQEKSWLWGKLWGKAAFEQKKKPCIPYDTRLLYMVPKVGLELSIINKTKENSNKPRMRKRLFSRLSASPP